MYANFTEETATSAGDVLTLTGASSDNIPFSASFTDGDLVAYVATDSSGVKVSGIGTYNAGTITRNDSWNYNGTVVDKSPSTNIPLSGDIVVRCDVTYRSLNVEVGNPKLTTVICGSLSQGGGQRRTLDANKVYYVPFLNNTGAPINISSLVCSIDTVGASGAKAIMGFATALNGDPHKIIAQTAEFDVDSTGYKIVSCSGQIPCGWCFAVVTCNESFAIDASNYNATAANPLLASLKTGGALFTRHSARANRDFSPLSDPLPPSTGQDDLSSIPLIGIEPL